MTKENKFKIPTHEEGLVHWANLFDDYEQNGFFILTEKIKDEI